MIYVPHQQKVSRTKWSTQSDVKLLVTLLNLWRSNLIIQKIKIQYLLAGLLSCLTSSFENISFKFGNGFTWTFAGNWNQIVLHENYSKPTYLLFSRACTYICTYVISLQHDLFFGFKIDQQFYMRVLASLQISILEYVLAIQWKDKCHVDVIVVVKTKIGLVWKQFDIFVWLDVF